MSTILKAKKRDNVGSQAVKKIKREGLIPAIIYGAKENQNVAINLKDFETLYSKTVALTTVVEIEVDGKKTKAIAHKIDLDPVTDRPVHVDFFNCDDGKNIKAKPRLTFIGKDKSPGFKKGGFLNTVLRRVEIICDSESVIPHQIEIDASKLHLGSKITSKDVKLPSGVKFSKNGPFLIASITGRGKSSEENPAEGAEGASESGQDKKSEEQKSA
ncbi:MAG: 50S ribosomal protein L25/general stress protein Ctc [Rickettsiales bacterium]|nr:50S ribosomal protein L25/general stress protein Ctc [Rickettsiales bacterium]